MASEKLSAALDPGVSLAFFATAAHWGWSDTANSCSSFSGMVQRRDLHLSLE